MIKYALLWISLLTKIQGEHSTDDEKDFVVVSDDSSLYYDAALDFPTTSSFDEMIAVRDSNTNFATLASGLRIHYKEHGNVNSPNKIIMIMGIYMSKIGWELIISRQVLYCT